MAESNDRAIIIIGGEELSESTLARAGQFDEVFVVARTVPDRADRWVVDEDHSEASSRARLRRAVARLRARGIRAFGSLGDENEAAARADACALFPAARLLG